MKSIFTLVSFQIHFEQASFEKINVGQKDGKSAYRDEPQRIVPSEPGYTEWVGYSK